MRNCGNWTTAVKLSITCTFLVFGFYYWTCYGKCNITQELQQYKGQRDEHFSLVFVPRPPARFADCDDLFTGSTPVYKYNMSNHYWSHYPEFQQELKKRRPLEGYSGTKSTQTLALHYLGARSSIVNICETGFNLGHSSFNFLTANSKTIVHSFDIGSHTYAKPMSDFLLKHFPGRFFIHFGDSTKTVPAFIQANPAFRCDLIFVDGGHTYAVAKADLENFASIANRSNRDNAIIFDDYPSFAPWAIKMGRAWEHMTRRHRVIELMRCLYSNRKSIPRSTEMEQYMQGFVVGTLVP